MGRPDSRTSVGLDPPAGRKNEPVRTALADGWKTISNEERRPRWHLPARLFSWVATAAPVPQRSADGRSKRSRFMTFVQAATKSATNRSLPSTLA